METETGCEEISSQRLYGVALSLTGRESLQVCMLRNKDIPNTHTDLIYSSLPWVKINLLLLSLTNAQMDIIQVLFFHVKCNLQRLKPVKGKVAVCVITHKVLSRCRLIDWICYCEKYKYILYVIIELMLQQGFLCQPLDCFNDFY